MTKKSNPDQQSLMDMAAAVSKARAETRMNHLSDGFEARAVFEATHKPANTSIQDKLKAYRKKLVVPGIAALTLAADMDPNFMNGSSNGSGARFNVYAIDKLADLLHGLNSGHIKNAVNRSIVASLFRCADAGITFTGIAAQAAVCGTMKVEKDLAAALVRHTASESTAPTQASSTMNALAVLGAVANKGTPKHPVWQLTDAPVVERLKEVIAA
jgi:hypothetical protein